MPTGRPSQARQNTGAHTRAECPKDGGPASSGRLTPGRRGVIDVSYFPGDRGRTRGIDQPDCRRCRSSRACRLRTQQAPARSQRAGLRRVAVAARPAHLRRRADRTPAGHPTRPRLRADALHGHAGRPLTLEGTPVRHCRGRMPAPDAGHHALTMDVAPPDAFRHRIWGHRARPGPAAAPRSPRRSTSVVCRSKLKRFSNDLSGCTCSHPHRRCCRSLSSASRRPVPGKGPQFPQEGRSWRRWLSLS